MIRALEVLRDQVGCVRHPGRPLAGIPSCPGGLGEERLLLESPGTEKAERTFA